MKKIELSIPKPCHENWNVMTPEDKGRFCASCQKTVIDFTNMSDRQVAEFFKKPAGNVCGRFANDQLNRELELPSKRIPWIKYFFTMAIPAAIFSSKASAQRQQRTMGKIAICVKPGEKDSVKPVHPTEVLKTVTGFVIDQKGRPVSYASIVVTGTTSGTNADENGHFSLQLKEGTNALTVTAAGFLTMQVAVDGLTTVTIQMTAAEMMMLGEVMVVEKPSNKKPIPLMPAKNTDTAFSKFSVFPNPASSNSLITIQTIKLPPGFYELCLINSGGQIIQTNEVVVDKKKMQLSFLLNNSAAGACFVRLVNKTSGEKYTEKIIVNSY